MVIRVLSGQAHLIRQRGTQRRGDPIRRDDREGPGRGGEWTPLPGRGQPRLVYPLPVGAMPAITDAVAI